MLHQISKEQKQILIKHIQEFFYEERGDELGLIAAERFLEFVAFELGPAFYNIGVEDARKLVKEQTEHLETELHILERTLNQPRRK